MRNGATERLKPTLWRTCRALANKTRLRMLQAILRKPGMSVAEIALQFDISMAVASKYLRELNARGLLRAVRKAAGVRYWPKPDRSVLQASALLKALSTTFRTKKSPVDLIFRKATGFTHPRRILIISRLARRPARFGEIRIDTGMSATALKRHLRKLQARGLVRRDAADGVYGIATSGSRLDNMLLKLASEDTAIWR